MSNARDSVAVAPPMAMQLAKRWLLWNVEYRTNRRGESVAVKVPRYVDGERRSGNLTGDGHRLTDYGAAVAALAERKFSGLGFALGDGWQGIDFDHIDKRPELAALVTDLPGYVEYSPSGTGVHAIGYGRTFNVLGSNASGIEAYCEGRFFTFTGHRIGAGEPHDLSDYLTTNLRARHAAARSRLAVAPRPPVAVEVQDRSLLEVVDALRYLDANERETWIGVGQELRSLGPMGFDIWSQWSDTEKYPGGEELERWEGFAGTNTSWQAVFRRAEAVGWKNPRKLDAPAILASQIYQGAHVPEPPQTVQAIPEPPTVPATAVGRVDGQDYREADGKQRAASLFNVHAALEQSGIQIVHDEFQASTLIVDSKTGKFRALRDDDYSALRIALERGGFKPVASETIRSAVAHLAEMNKYDFAIAWANSLVWDGVPRIDTVMRDYYGCEDSAYTRSVGAYLFTALAGRALVPGIQADMAVIMIGLQGARKTSAVSALAPDELFFGEINLKRDDDALARGLRGKLVLEWAELRGLASRDAESIKAWVSRRHEEWTPKYKEFNARFSRRCIIIGTGNDDEILDDPTGERRWLPVHTGSAKVTELERNRDQLWAEGVARFKAGGIEWELAEALAKNEHGDFKIHDEWSDAVGVWLDAWPQVMLGEVPLPVKNRDQPFSLATVATQAVGLRVTDVKRAEQLRISKILRSFGFERKVVKIDGRSTRRWSSVTQSGNQPTPGSVTQLP